MHRRAVGAGSWRRKCTGASPTLADGAGNVRHATRHVAACVGNARLSGATGTPRLRISVGCRHARPPACAFPSARAASRTYALSRVPHAARTPPQMSVRAQSKCRICIPAFPNQTTLLSNAPRTRRRYLRKSRNASPQSPIPPRHPDARSHFLVAAGLKRRNSPHRLTVPAPTATHSIPIRQPSTAPRHGGHDRCAWHKDSATLPYALRL